MVHIEDPAAVYVKILSASWQEGVYYFTKLTTQYHDLN